MKILLLDIETAPNMAYVWGLWNQNIAISQIANSSYVLCWAAKWYGEKDVMFSSIQNTSHKQMLKKIHKLLDEADVVIHYNGTRFDIPTLNKEFVINELSPPAPYKQIDLLKVARNRFKFASNKLDYVAQALGLGKKIRHKGFELWVECMAKDEAAWELMESYNKQDVLLLEKLYDKLVPWIKNHPNYNLFEEKENIICTNCGSDHYQRRGFAYTALTKYPRYQCVSCGSWFRGNSEKNEKKVTGIV